MESSHFRTIILNRANLGWQFLVQKWGFGALKCASVVKKREKGRKSVKKERKVARSCKKERKGAKSWALLRVLGGRVKKTCAFDVMWTVEVGKESFEF